MTTLDLHVLNDIRFYLGNDNDVNSLILIEPRLDRYYHDITEYNQDTKDSRYPNRILKLKINKNVNLEPFTNLVYLDCSSCKLTTLPKFPNLKILKCGNNQLEILPEFPNLKFLGCEYNILENLPEFPNLTTLHCIDNELTSLPEFDRTPL
jgi:hypothetical protein